MTMTKIVRITQHTATEEQRHALAGIWPGATIEEKPISLPNGPREAVAAFDEAVGDADVAEVVLPMQLINPIRKFSKFCERGGTLIRAHMSVHETLEGTRQYSFENYEELLEVTIKTRALFPLSYNEDSMSDSSV